MTDRGGDDWERLRRVFAYTALILWAGSIVLDALIADFRVHPSVTSIAAGVAVTLFGLPIVRKGG